MIGLFGTLNLATRSMQTQQAGVEIAGQNLANINNPAYARQRLVLETSPTVATPVGPQGSGVQITAIQQVRDMLLDGQICEETSVGGYWDAQQVSLQNTQTALGEFLDQSASTVDSSAAAGSATGAQGLSLQITRLFNSFQSVASSPLSLSERQSLVSNAQTLADSFNEVSSRLTEVAEDLDSSVATGVDSANELLADIAELNRLIARSENPKPGSANDLRDSRQQKLESLATLVDFETGSAADGSLTISVGGRTVVSGPDMLDTLEIGTNSSGNVGVMFSSDATEVSLNSGSISGVIAARDETLLALREGLDTLASELISTINSVYSGGYDLNGNTGAELFSGSSAATMSLNAALLDDPSLVQAAGSAGASGDNSVALALAQMGGASQPGLGNKTFDETYGLLVAGLGGALSNANEQLANHSLVNGLLATRRDSVSGVSMEEEMTNLISFQKVYQASAQIVSVVDQMLDVLLNMKR